MKDSSMFNGYISTLIGNIGGFFADRSGRLNGSGVHEPVAKTEQRLGKEMARMRSSMGRSRDYFASSLSISPALLREYEQGERFIPGETVVAVSRLCNVSAAHFYPFIKDIVDMATFKRKDVVMRNMSDWQRMEVVRSELNAALDEPRPVPQAQQQEERRLNA